MEMPTERRINRAGVVNLLDKTSIWHAVTAEEVLERLSTSLEKGLNANEAAIRLESTALNRLPEGKKQGPLKPFLTQFNNIQVQREDGDEICLLYPTVACGTRSLRSGNV
jgi:magnesium-transporting ATPase (P-type)